MEGRPTASPFDKFRMTLPIEIKSIFEITYNKRE